jgi:Histidine kinase
MTIKSIIIFIASCLACTVSLEQGRFVDSLKQWIQSHPQVDSQYIQTLHRLSYRLSENDVNQSFAYYEQVAHLSDSLNFTFGKSLAQINLGILLANSANYDASNIAFFKAFDYAESCHSVRLRAVSLNNIGDNFNSLKNHKKCLEYIHQAISLNKEIKAWRGVAINYELLNRCHFDQGLYTEAKNDLATGLPFAILSGESYILSPYFLGFAKLHAVRGDIDSARYYFARALKEARIQNDSRNEFFVYLAEAKYLPNLPLNKKVDLLSTALTIAENTQYYDGISEAAEELSDVYDKEKNTDSSLKYYRIYRVAYDSIFSARNRRNLIINESEWRIKQKENENNDLLELSQLQKKQIIFKDILLLSSVFLLLLTVIAAFLINKNIQSKKKRTEVALKQKIAESQIQSLRSQMNPHFIFNSLNSIENFMMQNEKRKASDYLHKFSMLMRSILESNQKEVASFSRDMEALKLYVELEQMRFQGKFNYQQTIDPRLIEGDYFVPSLLIQPFVENAIIHGIAPSEKTDLLLKVSAVLNQDYIKYVIEDNGVGRTKAEAYKKINRLHHVSLGLKITEDRILLFNQDGRASENIKITDLYDGDGNPCGTKVEVNLKAR